MKPEHAMASVATWLNFILDKRFPSFILMLQWSERVSLSNVGAKNKLTSNRCIIVLLAFIIGISFFQAGCQQNGETNPLAATSNISNSNDGAAVSFQLVFPRNDISPYVSASMAASTASQAVVTFQIKLLNYDNPSNPFSLISKQVLVVNASASVVIESLPTTTILGKIHIENGKIEGHSDFHGAIDLIQGINTVDLAPIGSLMPQDVVANAIEKIVSSSTLFLNAPKTLAQEISKIVSNLLLDSDTAYDEVINNFNNRNGLPVVEMTSPCVGQNFTLTQNIEIMASAIDLDGRIGKVEFFQGSIKIGEDTSAPFTLSWTCPAAGSYKLTAKAFDTNSAVSISKPIFIWVDAYSVTYNGNGNTGGTVPTDTRGYSQNEYVLVKGNAGNLVKTNCLFAGWSNQPVGLGLSYIEGKNFQMGAEHLTLYAQWVPAFVDFKMVDVPAIYEFPLGADDLARGSVANPFLIAETEVTYELWYSVCVWATNQKERGSKIYNLGDHNFIGRERGCVGSGFVIDGYLPTLAKTNPVVYVSWRDVVVWLNALSEMNGLEPVYRSIDGSILRNRSGNYPAGEHPVDQAVQTNLNGYRLPTDNEWELAARWIGNILPTQGAIAKEVISTSYNGSIFCWTPGNYISGATGNYLDLNASDGFGWYFDATTDRDPHPVRQKKANVLGLYDMSGNASEWTFNKQLPINRSIRGGGKTTNISHCTVGYVDRGQVDAKNCCLGFRIAKDPE